VRVVGLVKPSPSQRFALGPSLSRGAGEGNDKTGGNS
jgi:hypothetical protein